MSMKAQELHQGEEISTTRRCELELREEEGEETDVPVVLYPPLFGSRPSSPRGPSPGHLRISLSNVHPAVFRHQRTHIRPSNVPQGVAVALDTCILLHYTRIRRVVRRQAIRDVQRSEHPRTEHRNEGKKAGGNSTYTTNNWIDRTQVSRTEG
jgi:hypothetical protein